MQISKTSHYVLLLLTCCAGWSGLGSTTLAQDFNGDARPDLLWRNKATGSNKIWLMDGVQRSSEQSLPSTALGWRIAGTGDFNGDKHPDILWQHKDLDGAWAWYMEGTTFTGNVGAIMGTGDLRWRIAATGDLGQVANGQPNSLPDGKVDLVWQHETTGQKAIWYMDGTLLQGGYLIGNAAADPNWKIVGSGRFAYGATVNLVLHNPSTRQTALWAMSGKDIASGDYIRNESNPNQIVEVRDQDWKIATASQFNASGGDDLFWRYAVLGQNAVWYMNGQFFQSSQYADHLKDPAWRAASQDLEDSKWRQQAFYPTISAVALSQSITLNFNLPPQLSYGVTLERRQPPSNIWELKASNHQTSTFTDGAVQPNTLYEYRLFREGFAAPTKYKIWSGINVGPTEKRGKILLVIDKTVKGGMASALGAYTNNLIGDGWYVTLLDAERHKDSSWPSNTNEIRRIRSALASAYNADNSTRCVVLIGHVPIPYSGYIGRDGHTATIEPPDHQGAWPADMYYGDINGNWTDTGHNYVNSSFPENSNGPGDGKFDNNYPPSSLELAVGRIDFARLPAFGAAVSDTPTSAEISLLNRYFAKDHNYRTKNPPFPLNQKAVAGSFLDGVFDASPEIHAYRNAARNASALFGTVTEKLVMGDVYEQKTESFLLGYVCDRGLSDRINTTAPFSFHTTRDLAQGVVEAPIAFYVLHASYMGDWYFADDFLRATLATPNYGLAAMWFTDSPWRFESLAMGDYLGNCWVRMVNDPDYSETNPSNNYHRFRELAILGDPALRLHTLKPPGNLTGTILSTSEVELKWTESEPSENYYIFRSSSKAGPYGRIGITSGATYSFRDNAPTGPSASQRHYVVRGSKTVTSGTGSYKNLGQGSLWP